MKKENIGFMYLRPKLVKKERLIRFFIYWMEIPSFIPWLVLRAAVAVVLKQRNDVVDLFLDGERTIADAAVAQREAGLLQEVFFLPHRQFVLLRQLNRRRRADLFAASTEDAASKIELPRQLSCGEVSFNR